MKPQLLLIFVFIFLLMGGVSALNDFNINILQSPTNPLYTANLSYYFPLNISINNLSNPNYIYYNFTNNLYKYYDSSVKVFYNFDNISLIGDSISQVTDLSLSSNNGTLLSGSFYNLTGYYNSAVYFNGSGRININNNSDFQINNKNITFCLWFYFVNASRSSEQLFGKNANYEYVMLHNSDTNVYFANYNSSGTQIALNTGAVSPNIWYHYCIVSNKTNFLAYKNGVYVGISNNINNLPQSTNLSIGNNLQGSIDDFIVYNRSLSAYEVYLKYSSNLNKINQTSWNFYINQSNNKTTFLQNKQEYNYQILAQDSLFINDSSKKGFIYIFNNTYNNSCNGQMSWLKDSLYFQLWSIKQYKTPDNIYNNFTNSSKILFSNSSDGTFNNITSSICSVNSVCGNITYNFSGLGERFYIPFTISGDLAENDFSEYSGLGFWYKGDGSNNWIAINEFITYEPEYMENKAVGYFEGACLLNHTEWRFCYTDFNILHYNTSSNPINYSQLKRINRVTLIILNTTQQSNTPITSESGNIYIANMTLIDLSKGSMYIQNWKHKNLVRQDSRYQESVYNLAYLYTYGGTGYQGNETILNATIDAMDFLINNQYGLSWISDHSQLHGTGATSGFIGIPFMKALMLIKNSSRMSETITVYVEDNETGLVKIPMTNSRSYFYNLTAKNIGDNDREMWLPAFTSNQYFGMYHARWLYYNYSGNVSYLNSINGNLTRYILENLYLSTFGIQIEENTSDNIGFDMGYKDVSYVVLGSFYQDSKLPILETLLRLSEPQLLNVNNNYYNTFVNSSRGSTSSGGVRDSPVYKTALELNLTYLRQWSYLTQNLTTLIGSSTNGYNLLAGITPWRSMYWPVSNYESCNSINYTSNGFRFPQNYSFYSYDLNTLSGFSRRFIEHSGAITDRTGLEFPQMIYSYDNDTDFWIGNETNIYFNSTNPYFSDINGNFPLKINITRFGYNGDTSKVYLYSKNYYRNYNINNGIQFIYDSYHGYIYNNLSSNINTTNYNLTNCLIRYPNNSGQIINSNNVNFTIPSKNSSWFGNNYQLTESRPLEGEPFTISKTTSGLITTYTIESELNNEVTIPVSLDVDCENLKSLSINGLSSTNYTCSGNTLIILGMDVNDSSTLSSIIVNSYVQDQINCTSFMNAFLGYIPFYGILFAIIISSVAIYIIMNSLGKIKGGIDLDGGNINYYQTTIVIFIIILVMSITLGLAYIFNSAICGL